MRRAARRLPPAPRAGTSRRRLRLALGCQAWGSLPGSSPQDVSYPNRGCALNRTVPRAWLGTGRCGSGGARSAGQCP